MLGQRRGRLAYFSPALGERVVFHRLHTHRQRFTDSAKQSQVKQPVSTSVEGRYTNPLPIKEITILNDLRNAE